MKLKTIEVDGTTYAAVQDGKPVYIDDAGEEVAFDAPGTAATIKRLNAEAKGHREAKEAAEGALKAFEGLDPAKARDAMDKLAKVDAKQLVAAGDMDAAIKAAMEPVQADLERISQERDTLASQLNTTVVENAYRASKFAAEKLTPAGVDLMLTKYGNRVKVENGRPVGYDANGQKIYSKSSPGELADFDEVISSFVSEYPHKDHILKGSGAQGTGASGGSSGAGGKTITRREFDALSQADRGAKVKDGVKIVD